MNKLSKTNNNAGIPNAFRESERVLHRKNRNHVFAIRIALSLLMSSLGAVAGDPPVRPVEDEKLALADLGFSNLSAGWGEPWVRRSRGDGTPDMSLLRVQTNFLAQLSRTDYAHQENLAGAAVQSGDLLTETLEFKKFESGVTPEVKAAGPNCLGIAEK